MLNIYGLIAGFTGALLLLADPTSWILDDYTKRYIKDREARMTIFPYSDKERRKLIAQLWLRRSGLLLLVTGFLVQLLAALNAELGPWW